MAGRGVDIRLGDGASDLGGLCIVGLERFPSVRLDNQLRGRAGRQGDPGRSVFFTSLEDALVVENDPDHRPALHVLLDGAVLDKKLRKKLLRHAQRVADGQQRELRSLARRYGALPALQRDEILALRRDLLTTDRAITELADRIPDRVADLRKTVLAEALLQAARTACLSSLDRRWSDHIVYTIELREGIHLRALARLEPLAEFNRLLIDAYRPLVDSVFSDAAQVITRAHVTGNRLDLTQPASTSPAPPGPTWSPTISSAPSGPGSAS